MDRFAEIKRTILDHAGKDDAIRAVVAIGSSTRTELKADEYSDLDLFILVDSPRERIAEKNWHVGEIASDLFMDFGIVVSPIVENRQYYQERIQLLPFFGNISREGVNLRA